MVRLFTKGCQGDVISWLITPSLINFCEKTSHYLHAYMCVLKEIEGFFPRPVLARTPDGIVINVCNEL